MEDILKLMNAGRGKSLKTNATIAIALTILGWGLFALTFFISFKDPESPKYMRIFGLFFGIGGPIAYLEPYLKDRKAVKVMEAVSRHPEKLLWMYIEKRTSTGNAKGSTFVFFYLSDGTVFPFWLSEENAKLLYDKTAAELKGQFSMGFSPELWKTYKQNPSQLRSQPVENHTIRHIKIKVR